ncbi:conserved hypothetical protein [Gammaproteobacteria bacterium]
MIADLRRLVSLLDILPYLGDLLYRRSLRYTMTAATVSLLGYLADFLPGVETYDARVALLLPLVVGTLSLSAGLLLKNVPTLLVSRALAVAEAHDLDLMSDYRKSRQPLHLAFLWDRVFCLEWAVGSVASQIMPHPDESPLTVCFPSLSISSSPSGHGDPVRRGREEFLGRAQFALARHQPQTCQRHYLGLDLRFLEDWRQGGYFHARDTKLQGQLEHSAILVQVKREVGYQFIHTLHELPVKLTQRFWFRMITRSVGIQVGEGVAALNATYQTDWFNAQTLLWREGHETPPWLAGFPGVAEAMARYRQRILHQGLGGDLPAASALLDRMLQPGIWLAAELRARYDPEYLEGDLESGTLLRDLLEDGFSPHRLMDLRQLAQHTRRRWRSLQPWLADHYPGLWEPGQGEALRAVRVALHVRKRHLDRVFPCGLNNPLARSRLDRCLTPLVDEAIAAQKRYSVRLAAVRLHHELTRLHRWEYQWLLEKLWEP